MQWRTVLVTSSALALLAAGASAQTALGTTGGSDTVPPNPYVASPPPTAAFQGNTLEEQMLRAHQERNKSPGMAGPAGSPSGGVGGTTGGSDNVANAFQHVIPGTTVGKSAMETATPGPYYYVPQYNAYLHHLPDNPSAYNPGVGGTTGGSDSVPRR